MKGEGRYGEIDDNLVAEYVLGTLPHNERVAFAKRLRSDPSLAMAVRRWEVRLLPLADEITPVKPTETVYENIEKALFTEPVKPASWWSSLAVWQCVSAVSLAVALLLSASLFALQRAPDGFSPTYVGRVAGNPDIVQLLAAYDSARAVLKLNRTLGAPGQGRDFELWLIEGGNSPVSLGVLAEDRISQISVPTDLASQLDNAVLAISDEPAGGSPTGQVTGAVLATGNLVRL